MLRDGYHSPAEITMAQMTASAFLLQRPVKWGMIGALGAYADASEYAL
jgi:hypothetical protein